MAETRKARGGSTVMKLWRASVPLRIVVPLVLAALTPETVRWIRGHERALGGGAAEKPDLGIKTLAQQVRLELAAVEREMLEKDEKPLFDLKAFEMELNFIVKASTSESVGVKTELVTAESDIQTGSERVQKLILHWEASKPEVFTAGASTDVGDAVMVEAQPTAKGDGT